MWEELLVETSRGQFQCFKKGSGSPIVVTHHYSEYNENGNVLAEYFTKYFTVYLVNLRGTGKSVGAIIEEDYSLQNTVVDLEAIREALHFENWGFVGHSTGGMLALQYATTAMNSLSFIVAGGTAASYEYAQTEKCMYNSKHPYFNRVREIMDLLSDANTSLDDRKKLGYEWALMSYYKEENLQRMLTKPNSGKTVGSRLTYFRQKEYQLMDFRPQLHKITVPSFIYAGRHDIQCTVEFGVEIAELIPHAKLFIYEESNHFPFAEEEEKFAEMVAQIFEQVNA